MSQLDLVLYCRAGFESECAQEIEQRASEVAIYGFSKTKKKQGFVVFSMYNPDDAETLIQRIEFNSLCFARQWFIGYFFEDLDTHDRVTPLTELVEKLSPDTFNFLHVESPDTETGKALQGFCRKITAPFSNRLKNQGLLKKSNKYPNLHTFFTDSTTGYIGFSPKDNSSPHFMGIDRLKFPSSAPSRSTLKLEEAFRFFMTKEQQSKWLQGGIKAVDLGSAPGGWTWQLVKRSIWVQAIDNGPMDEELMESGIVNHIQADGFKYWPEKSVDWIVCDMIEKPSRVAKLIGKWLAEEKARMSIFNLKLPMNKRYQELQSCLETINSALEGKRYQLKVKQLYHDREEVTVFIILGN